MRNSWCACKIKVDRGAFVCKAMALESTTFFFGSELTTLPALSLFTAYDKAIDASDVVTFHVTDTDVHDATDSL